MDEFSNFATPSFVGMLSEARKYALNLTICNQLLAQLDLEMRAAIFGNVGTLISFQVGSEDAEYVAREFAPVFTCLKPHVDAQLRRITTQIMGNHRGNSHRGIKCRADCKPRVTQGPAH